ncbi:hypothetical protein BKA69DRAFT_879399 [Paraphysoderma sedebokerense]|nr:hypothetical protein BKA69DRAFT_879399 [Paraphysoderma sedebokerense]
MKTNPLLVLCSLLLLLTADSEAAAPSCQRPRLRKEVRDLTPQEWQAYTGAIRQLKASGRYDGYTRIHVQYTQQAHGGQNFLPWHRRLLYDFETDIINLTNGAVRGIPYFDSHSSYGIFDPQSSVYVGNPTGCVTEGPFAGFMAVDGQCVTRAYNASVTAVDPRVIAALILENQPFATYSDTYEFGQHAAVHSAIGGHMATLTGSTNDPMFFMHHAHVDYIWYKRQWANPQQTYWDLNGQHGGQPVNLQSLIPGPWAENNGRGFQISDTYWTLW